MNEQAIRYLRRAGDTAVEASAFSEAIDAFAKALSLVEQLPKDPEREREELAICIALARARQQKLWGSSEEVERTYLRALDLCTRCGGSDDRFTIQLGLWFYRYQRGEIHRSREFGDGLVPLAENLDDPALILEAHHVQWATRSVEGNLRVALGHTEEAIARYDRKQHHRLTFLYGGDDPGACARNVNALLLCILGYPEQALRRSQAALALAQELAHPYTLEMGYYFALVLGVLIRDPAGSEDKVTDFCELIRAGKLRKEASIDAEFFRGWVLAERGSTEGIALIRSRMSDLRTGGAWTFVQVATAAVVLGNAGHSDEGIQLITETLDAAERGGAHWFDAELYRVRASLRFTMDPRQELEVERELKKAIAVANDQEARFFQLRAATDLARIWIERGERQRANDLLAPILNWFAEGWDTPDLVNAKACLQAAGA